MEEKNYIVYQITNKINNNIYIGCHVTENIEDSYMGSGTNIKKALKEFGREKFDKIVLHNFDNKEDMIEKEEQLVNREFIKRQDTYNISIGGKQFLTLDTVSVKDKNNNYSRVHKTDPRYLSGELVSAAKGKITVRDKNNNYSSVDVTNPRYLSGELVLSIASIDKVTIKDKDGNTFQVDRNDPRYLYGELVGYAKNMVLVKDNIDNYYMVDKTDPRYLNGEFVAFWKGKKHTEESKKKIGKANSIHQKGEGNSQFGTCWIYNEKKKESKKIKKDELDTYTNDGWLKGRKMKF